SAGWPRCRSRRSCVRRTSSRRRRTSPLCSPSSGARTSTWRSSSTSTGTWRGSSRSRTCSRRSSARSRTSSTFRTSRSSGSTTAASASTGRSRSTTSTSSSRCRSRSRTTTRLAATSSGCSAGPRRQATRSSDLDCASRCSRSRGTGSSASRSSSCRCWRRNDTRTRRRRRRDRLRRVRAVVIERPHDVAFREVETPACGPGDVLVRSRLAGVCRTDLEVLAGELDRRWVTYPCVPGHEWSGVIEQVGEEVTGLAPGDRVVCEGFCYCGVCRRCRAGDTNLCERYDQLGFTRAGGYGELVLVPRRVVHKLPERVSLEAAVLIEPASVVLKGLERARPEPGETVGVVGVGIREPELELARRLGATEAVDVSGGTATHAGELDLVVETAGAVPALELATRLAREGGRVVALGIAGAGRELRIAADTFTLRDLALIGSVGYTTATWSRVVELIGAGLVDLEPVIARRVPAERFAEAFRLMAENDGVVGRILLQHE